MTSSRGYSDRLLASALALLVFVAPAPAAADEEVVFDRWMAQFQRETKAGWAHERRVRTTSEDGQVVIVSEHESEMVRGPGGELMKTPIVSSSRFVEDEQGRVLSYSTSVDIGFGPQTREGTVDKDGVISAKDDGKPRTAAYPEGALGPAAIQRALAAALKPNATAEALAFSPHDPQTGRTVRWKVQEATQPADILGYHVWLWEVERTEGSSPLPERLFVGGDGAVWGGAMNMGLIRFFRTEELVAKADRDPAAWMLDRVVGSDRVIPLEEARKSIRLRLSWADGKARDLPESNMQKIVARGEGGSLDVELLGAPAVSDLVIWMRPYTGGDQDPQTLAATPLVELSHDRVKRTAAMAVGERKDALGSAMGIERFVKATVHPSRPNVGFNSAAGVLSSRTGDFTEAAVLAVALARAEGLPARLVAGFSYWGPATWADKGKPQGAFVFHTWAEIYVGDKLWHPVDPMALDATREHAPGTPILGQTGYDATHVAVLRSDLDTTQPFTDIAAPVLEWMDGLTIEVLEPR